MNNEASSHYERIGGEQKVRELVQRFYHLMDELPEAHGIRKMHHINLKNAEDKLFMFLSGWMDGPQLFIEKFGHPRLRQRHMPFVIGESERDQWMLCMTQALQEVVEDEALRNELIAAFYKVADFMRNQPG
ncbi:MAG: group II truncated hemoglobin [Gallionellaceae bacterium]